jgi:hypothetical protein
MVANLFDGRDRHADRRRHTRCHPRLIAPEDLVILPRRHSVTLAALLGLLPGVAVGWFDLPAALPMSSIALRAVGTVACALMWAGAFGLVAFVITRHGH